MQTETVLIEEPAQTRSAVTKYAIEAIGTFILVSTVGAAVGSGSVLAPLGIGAVLMAMVYAGGHISGAHYNPAVTLAVLIRGRINLREAAGYWVAQISAGVVAAVAVSQFVSIPAPSSVHVSAVFFAELLFTFVLCFVVLNVATSRDHPDNSFYGLAIGFTVTAGAVAVGSISGAAFNPAVVLGGAAMGLFAVPMLWVFLAAQLLAGVGAGIAFRILNPDDK